MTEPRRPSEYDRLKAREKRPDPRGDLHYDDTRDRGISAREAFGRYRRLRPLEEDEWSGASSP